ncbi:MAG: radical SAM protein [Lachnospiraceae bacterium]|jgi:pyruvate formate lyase activating enzyme|nr:radical SAM protein [Lachnospiraceae bacterium]
MLGDVMSISRLRMATDGQGVSTLVGFYGCPLHCRYCANEFCHGKKGFWLEIPRAAYRPEELVEVLRKDEIYYLMTGGGIVFGGGEPLLQSAFVHEVCRQADPRWKKRVETSLNVPWESVVPLIDDIDEWIIDIKDMDSRIYEAYTGADNENVLRNLNNMRDIVPPGRMRIRVPHIAGFNTPDDVEKSVGWIRKVLHVEPEVFTYHLF